MFELLPDRLISVDYNARDGSGSQKTKNLKRTCRFYSGYNALGYIRIAIIS